ncbi:MAG: PEP-CTERM sorting domain-containing protein [Proteobacteria bacterium]|nr:PEP-CTERM sorting domain-containing protein [Pseudomonadota bacterium]
MQNSVYWSGTEYAPHPGLAWTFNTDFGDQDNVLKANLYYAWAVRSGDVAAVPEPGVMGLLGIGALAWAGAKARRRG